MSAEQTPTTFEEWWGQHFDARSDDIKAQAEFAWNAGRASLEAEIAALRDALTACVAALEMHQAYLPSWHNQHICSLQQGSGKALAKARAALGGEPA